MNLNVKKKLKEYDNFKNLMIECLEEIFKKIPKKIRKMYEGELINKNRTNKCEILFKSINHCMNNAEEQQTLLTITLHKEFSITQIEYEKIGL